jgi:uncharacterized damage-inducible protein DinB
MPDSTPPATSLPEPWLRGTLTELPAVPRAVLHALELAHMDLHHYCGLLSDAQLNARPATLAPVAFHLRHIARSLDRLLSYAEGRSLSPEQILQHKSELEAISSSAELFSELDSALVKSATRIRQLAHSDLNQPRRVGRQSLPTTLGGLLVHVADHTQRHVGQAITTSKIVSS